jgi:outer membrane protein
MKSAFRCQHNLVLAVVSVFLYAGIARADDMFSNSAGVNNNDFTILNNAANVTHWGLGAGSAYEESPYKQDGGKFSPISLIFFDDKWVHAFGAGIDLKVGQWNGLSVTLRGDFALGDGYKQSDAPILNGMSDRNGAFWYGPAFAWDTAFGKLSADYLFGGNKGEKAHLEFSRSFEAGRFSIEPHAGVEWLSGKYVSYYYGVQMSEVEADRPAYIGKAAYDMTVGTRIDYHFTPHQMATFDVGVSSLGSGIKDSPLVGKRYIPEVKVGYIYMFN